MGWSLLVGAMLSLTRSHARRLRPLDFAPFESALAAIPPERDGQIGALLGSTTVARVQELMDVGAFSAEELTLHVLARIQRLDDALCSVIELNPAALGEARAADERRRSGSVLGVLDGIPLTIKDNIETALPMHTTGGSMILADHVAGHDADVVAALRRAGAVIVGKANLSELAGAMARTPGVSAVGGQTRNPYGERFTPGGLEQRLRGVRRRRAVPRQPRDRDLGFAHRPGQLQRRRGHEAQSRAGQPGGVIPLVSFQDSVGPLARTVADAAALLRAIANGGLELDLTADALQGVPVGVLREDILGQKSPFADTSDNAAVLSRIEEGLLAAGASVQDASLVPERRAERLRVGLHEGGLRRPVPRHDGLPRGRRACP